MRRIARKLAEVASKLLERDDRESLLGALLETNQSALYSLLEVLFSAGKLRSEKIPAHGSRHSLRFHAVIC